MATHSPRGVVLACLMQPVPCPRCQSTRPCRCMVDPGERLEWQAGLIVAALEENGHLDPTEEPELTIEQVAVWLAAQSSHPRYVAVEDGWKSLLDPATERNIHHAHAAALQTHPRPTREYEQALADARDRLLAHVADRRAAGEEG